MANAVENQPPETVVMHRVVDEDARVALVSADQTAATPPHVPTRCGLIAIVGKPNVGKSTLLNALVGQKISIVSRKAQTTRHRIQGVFTLGQSQYVFADTPGFQTLHTSALNKSLNKAVQGALSDVDVVVFVVDAGRFNTADRKVLELINTQTKGKTPVLLVANKVELTKDKRTIAEWLKAMPQEGNFAEYIPMSAKNPKHIERLLNTLETYLPEQDWMFADDELTDKSERFLVGETIREKLFRLTGDELPYTSTVIIDQFKEQPGQTAARYVEVAATIIVERDSHKAMVIGEGGEKLRRIGTEARLELQHLMDAKMHLTLWVKVKSGWADNEAHVRSFGYL